MAVTVKRQSLEFNFEWDKGSTFRYTWTWKSGPEGGPYTLVDLTGCTAEMHIRSTDGTLLHTLSTTLTTITLGGVNGTIEAFISNTDMEGFTWDYALYDLDIKFTNNDVRKFVRGSFTLFSEQTKPGP